MFSHKGGKYIHFLYDVCCGMLLIIFAVNHIGLNNQFTSVFFTEKVEKQELAFEIINTHEVIQTKDNASKLIKVMDATGITKTVLAGTPREIFFYTGEKGFTDYTNNNDTVLAIAKENPDRFIAFCTLNVSEKDYMVTVEQCLKKGAQGFKLYSGHTFFYDKKLDDPSVLPLYAYLSENNLPLIFHVNTAEYQKEFENVLNRYPDLTVICPHYCVSAKNIERLSTLLSNHQNLFIEISFGDEQYMLDGMDYISKNIPAYKDFFTTNADRILFGTDIAITDYEGKDETWLTSFYRIYRNFLEKEAFTIFLNDDSDKIYNGLALLEDVLNKIYSENWRKITASS